MQSQILAASWQRSPDSNTQPKNQLMILAFEYLRHV
jgi:hypothetical protein